jgi:uncharacterized membrane protein YhaH (DUF805 family)
MLLVKIIRNYSNFSGKSGRMEYAIYQLFFLIINLIVFDMATKINFMTNDVLYLFYVWILILITFIPNQSVTVRRINDLSLHRGLIFFNFIPIGAIFFKIYLLISIGKTGRDKIENKKYKNDISEIQEIGNS